MVNVLHIELDQSKELDSAFEPLLVFWQARRCFIAEMDTIHEVAASFTIMELVKQRTMAIEDGLWASPTVVEDILDLLEAEEYVVLAHRNSLLDDDHDSFRLVFSYQVSWNRKDYFNQVAVNYLSERIVIIGIQTPHLRK